jgi:hypothetical protein
LGVALAPTSAVAQAGSTGGTIGKQGKSVSGSEPEAKPPSAVRKPNKRGENPSPPAAAIVPSAQSPGTPATASPCAGTVGIWSWFIGGDVVIKTNGTVEAVNGLTARWQCNDGLIVMTWSNGFVDRLTLSSDRTKLSGTNNWGLGVSATRK